MPLLRQIGRSATLASLVIMIWNQALLSDDIWSPGSGGQVWARISRLQSVGVKSQVRSPFVTDSCSSDDPVERLAAIAWIGRTRSEKHIPDLERLLADKISQVRQLAFEALLVLDDPLAKKLVLQTMLEVDDYSDEELATPSYRRGYSGGLSSVRDNESALTDLLKGLSLKDRRVWVEKCVDQPQWLLETQYERNDTKFDFRSVLKQSVFHRGASLPVSVDLLLPGSRAAEENESLRIERVRDLNCIKHRLGEPFWESGQLFRTHMKEGLWNYEVKANSPSVVPGVYAFAFRSPDASMGAYDFPFFIRINRSQEDEKAIPALISQLPNKAAAQKLGELRSREAVPKLIEYFRNSAECEHVGVGSLLGIIGDGRAAEAFLDLPTTRCQDSGGYTGDWINELDATAQVAISQRLTSISELTHSWDTTEDSERSIKLECYSLALAYSDRPLTRKQSEDTEQFVDMIALRSKAMGDTDFPLFQAINLVIAYSRGDPLILPRMLKKLEVSPRLYLHAVQSVMSDNRFEIKLSKDCRMAVHETLVDWVSRANLKSELQDVATRLIKRFKIDFRLPTEHQTSPTIARFGKEYYMDNRRGLWCKDQFKSNLWCTFCRPISSWSVVDAETVCVATPEGSMQMVRAGKSIKSWSSGDLWKSFDARSKTIMLQGGQLGQRVGMVEGNLVVSIYGSLVMILPLSENGSPWIVGVPTIREQLLPKANEDDNPFTQSADFTPTLNQRVGGGYSRVWAKGDRIVVHNAGEYSFAIQCVNLNTQKVEWEKREKELDLPKLIETEGWRVLNK